MHETPLILTHTPRAPLERLDPRTKLVGLAMWLVCVVSTPVGAWWGFAAYTLVLLCLLVLNARLLGRFAKRLAPAVPPLLLLCLLLPLFRGGRPVWAWGPLTVTHEGLLTAVRLGWVALLSVGGAALLWASTRPELLSQGLRGVGVPQSIVNVLAFMLRYLDVLRPELHRLLDARESRLIGPHRRRRLTALAQLVGNLLLRAYERAERVADAMAARGFTGRWRTFHRPHFHARDALALLLLAAVLAPLRLALA